MADIEAIIISLFEIINSTIAAGYKNSCTALVCLLVLSLCFMAVGADQNAADSISLPAALVKFLVPLTPVRNFQQTYLPEDFALFPLLNLLPKIQFSPPHKP